jgi:hypothetical protein
VKKGGPFYENIFYDMIFWHIFAKIFVFAKRFHKDIFSPESLAKNPCVKDRSKCTRQLDKIYKLLLKKMLTGFSFHFKPKKGLPAVCSQKTF